MAAKREIPMAINIVEKIDDPVKVKHVIVSVSDKSGLDILIPALIEMDDKITLYSTGGTFKALHDIIGGGAVRNLVEVSDYTGHPEMQGGLVKTLDFKIYLGLLSETYNEDHRLDLDRARAIPIDMVVVNLYPFKATVARPDVTVEQARANIDIGGPCMLRAAAKNFLRVASVTDPNDYPGIISELKENKGCISLKTRFNLAQKAFAHTAEYDTAISKYLAKTDFRKARGCYNIQK